MEIEIKFHRLPYQHQWAAQQSLVVHSDTFGSTPYFCFRGASRERMRVNENRGKVRFEKHIGLLRPTTFLEQFSSRDKIVILYYHRIIERISN